MSSLRVFRLLAATGVIGASLLPLPLAAQNRTVAEGRWVELFRVDDNSGDLLMDPQAIQISGSSLLVYDRGAIELRSFSRSGAPQWRVGQLGSGPGEFRMVTAIAGDGQGGAVVLDNRLMRFTFVRRDGSVASTVQATQMLDRLTRDPSGRLIASPPSGALAVIHTTSGRPIATVPLPPDQSEVSAMLIENRPHAMSTGAVAFIPRWTTEVLVLEADHRTLRRFHILNPQPLPPVRSYNTTIDGQPYAVTRVHPQAREIAGASTVDGHTLHMVDRRATAGGVLLDSYDLRTGSYLGSRRLPQWPVALAVRGDTAFAVVSEPLPALVGWVWEGKPPR